MSKEIPLATVKTHNKPNDLWLIIDNKVYDVTKFLHEASPSFARSPLEYNIVRHSQLQHPGGEETLIDVAGRDGTKAFNDVGHSSEARSGGVSFDPLILSRICFMKYTFYPSGVFVF